MHQIQIQLSDEMYDAAVERASETGCSSVDLYLAKLLAEDVADPENYDHIFTPEVLASLDEASAEVRTGKGLTVAQVREDLAKMRTQWLKDNPR